MTPAIVTGATSGIGHAAALALAEAGWWVLATGRDEQRGRALAEQLGDRGEFLPVDLLDRDAERRLVEHVLERRGALALLVNNAAIHFLATVPETSDERYSELMRLNLDAAFRLAAAAVRAMSSGDGGVIVNVASEAGIVAIPGQAAYNVSKAALLMLTRSIAVDHAGDGIRAVSICPGTTHTPLVERAIASAEDPDAHARKLAGSRPLGRLGKPEEMAAAIVFAASDAASFMTGTELIVDGGFTAT